MDYIKNYDTGAFKDGDGCPICGGTMVEYHNRVFCPCCGCGAGPYWNIVQSLVADWKSAEDAMKLINSMEG